MSNNYPFKTVSINPNYRIGHEVQWDIEADFKGSIPFKFSVQLSDDLSFNNIISQTAPDDTFYTIESSKLVLNNNNNFLLRVKLEDGDGNEYFSKPQYLITNLKDRQKYLYAAEIMRKELLLSERAGYRCKALKRKVFGPSILSKLDPVSGVPLTYEPTDFGTGVDGGYYRPFATYYRMENIESEVKLNDQGTGINDNTVLRVSLPGFPILSVKDIIVTEDDIRYIINSLNFKYFPGTNIVIKQTGMLNMLPLSDKIYQLDITKLS